MKRLSYALLVGIFAMSGAGAAQASQDPNYQAPSKIDPVAFDLGIKGLSETLARRSSIATYVPFILKEMNRLELGIPNGQSEESKCQQLKEFFEAHKTPKKAISESLNEYFTPKRQNERGQWVYRHMFLDDEVVLPIKRQWSDAARQLAES